MQSVESAFPERALLRDPVGDGYERAGVEAAVMDAPLATPLEESGLLEDLHVLRDRREGNLERPGELRDARLAAGEVREDRAPSRVRERRERAVQGRRTGAGIVNQ